MGPVICLITDRRRAGAGDAGLVARVRAAARAGVDLVQIRERDLDGRALADLVARCVTAVSGTRTRIVVNDRLDVALSAGAHGVHLRSDSFPAARARGIAPPGFLVGRSVHSPSEAAGAWAWGAVDYLIFGAVFNTASKTGRAPAGVSALGDVVRATPIPVLGVGGVDVDNAGLVARAGAAGVAGIGVFTDGATELLEATVQGIVRAFDTSECGS